MPACAHRFEDAMVEIETGLFAKLKTGDFGGTGLILFMIVFFAPDSEKPDFNFSI
jgi:hypothetical protein